MTYSLSPALPAGLSFDAATRTLSGTPTGLQATTSYTYKVVDANADEATQSFNITVLTPLPSAPVNFQATAGDARVTLTWDNANDDTISSWEYQQKQGMGRTYGAWTSITNSDADTTAHALESLTNDTQYTFQLRAVNATGNGASSAGKARPRRRATTHRRYRTGSPTSRWSRARRRTWTCLARLTITTTTP